MGRRILPVSHRRQFTASKPKRKGGKRRDLRKHAYVRGGDSENYIHVVRVEVFPNPTSLNDLHMHGGNMSRHASR